MFERPDASMMYHLKPLFIREKVDNIGINKMFVEGGETVNVMPHYLFKKIRKFKTDLRPSNIVLSNYEGKMSHILAVIQVNLVVGTLSIPTFFIVTSSNANYNLLLGREWSHGIGAVPLTLHQRISIWLPNGIVENIKSDQGYYMANVSHVSRRNFDKKPNKDPTLLSSRNCIYSI